MNFIVILSAYFLVNRILRVAGLVDSFISVFICYFSQIVISEIFLGIFDLLYIEYVILINLVILLVIWLKAKNKVSTFSMAGVSDTIPILLKNKIILLGLSAILGFGLVKTYTNLINPPFGWDSLNYHFTFAVEWLKHGNLSMPITVSDDPSPPYYPINGSLFYLWLIFPLKNVFFADLGQIPFFALALLAVYSISRKVKLNKELSLLSAILFALIPNFFKQISIAYVDIMVAALFLACINYLFLLEKDFSIRHVVLFSLGLGLFLGTKTTALPYSALLFVPVAYLALRSLKKSYLLGVSAVIILILGGFTYLRNFMNTGNPFYPLVFNLLGKNIYKGVIGLYNYRAHFNPNDYRLDKLLFSEGLGAQSLILILPAVFLGLPVALAKVKRSLNLGLVYFLVLPILMYVVYRFIIPLPNTRYLYHLLGLGIIIAFYTINNLRMPGLVTNILVMLCILVSMGEISRRSELITALIVTLSFFLLFPNLIGYVKRLTSRGIAFLVILFSLVVISGLIFFEQDYQKNEYGRYVKMVKYSGFWPDVTRAWEWLNKNTSGNNIAYIGRPVPFPLYGSGFKNNVYYVSVNSTEPARLHYFPRSHYQWGHDFLSVHKNLEAEGNYRSAARYGVWLRNLLRRKIDYLFVYSLHQTKDIEFPLEERWALEHPDIFKNVFINKEVHIYSLKR